MTLFEEIEEFRLTAEECEKEKEKQPVSSSREQYQDWMRERKALEDQERFIYETVWGGDYDYFYNR